MTGHDGKITSLRTTECEGIENESTITIFLYISMPYIVNHLLFLSVLFLKPNKNPKILMLKLSLLLTILIDTGWNLLGSFWISYSDFVKIVMLGKLGGVFFVVSFVMLWLNVYYLLQMVKKLKNKNHTIYNNNLSNYRLNNI